MPYKVSERSPYFKNLNSPGISLSIFLLIAASAWIYIWMRAALVPFQSDEAATFFMYVQPGNFLPPFSRVDANNHILNSFLTWISFKLFGSSPLSLRLPNVFAALIYFYFIFKISRLINWSFARWGFILLSAGTHFLLEFFSYSRGYGLSLAFLTGALYYMILALNEIRLKPAILATFYIILATAANLNMIFTALSIFTFLVIRLISGYKSIQRRDFLTGIFVISVAGVLASWYLADFSFQIRQVAGFYYGASTGFLPVTVKSLSTMISGHFHFFIEILAVSALIIAILLTFYQSMIKNKRSPRIDLYSLFTGILMINWIGALLLNHIFRVNYQEDRAAMHLIPIFYGMAFFGIDRLFPVFKRYSLVLLLPFLIIPAFSIRQVSLGKSVYGSSLQVPASYFHYIINESQGKDYPPVVSSYQARRQVWAYMNFRSGGILNPLMSNDFPNKTADFIIHELPLPDSLTGLFEPVLTDRNTQTALLRNKEPAEFILYKSLTPEECIRKSNVYHDLLRIETDSLAGQSLRLEADLFVESHKKPLEAAIVVELFDEDRKTLVYEAIDLDQLRPHWDNNNSHFRHVYLIYNIPPQSRSLLIYFWNKKKAFINHISGEVTIKLASGTK